MQLNRRLPFSRLTHIQRLSCLHQRQQIRQISVQNLRNVGIIAHIDAGKTTTTERMLYYSGATAQLGDVDSGDTVTDFLEEERCRGVTIWSAAATYDWGGKRVNLIDTPGHVDFTIEVERSLRVLDGAILLLDGVAGVQAQSETVWRQSKKFSIPTMVYVNKMDRDIASVEGSVRALRKKLGCRPVITQVVIDTGQGGKDAVLLDLIRAEEVRWSGKQGEIITRRAVDLGGNMSEWLAEGRGKLVEELAEFDEQLLEEYLEDRAIPVETLETVLRRATINCDVVPVVCGSSFKNWGVQALMDSLNKFLPSPLDRPAVKARAVDWTGKHKSVGHVMVKPDFKGPLVVFAFKVVHDKRRGPLVYVRVYSGTLKAKQHLRNSSRPESLKPEFIEKPLRLVRMHGDMEFPLDRLEVGEIGVLVGLKGTRTGDTLVSSKAVLDVLLPGIESPDPVFFAALYADSLTEQAKLENSLALLHLEDPSITHGEDAETLQTLIKGMGELHIDIAYNRLRQHYECQVDKGEVQISYREAITKRTEPDFFWYNRVFPSGRVYAGVTLFLEPIEYQLDDLNSDLDRCGGCENDVVLDPDLLSIEVPAEYIENNFANGMDSIVEALREGVLDGLQRGPLQGWPLIKCKVTITKLNVSNETTPFALKACATMAVADAVKKTTAVMMEPVMRVEVLTSHKWSAKIMADITGERRGLVTNYDLKDESVDEAEGSTITALIPLKNLVGYASDVRTLSAGSAKFSMDFHSYQSLSR